MKIIGINASPKGDASNTLKLVKSILAGAESEGAETKLVDLYKLNIEYCNACGTCYATGECPLIDDFEGFCCKNNFTAFLGYNYCFLYHY